MHPAFWLSCKDGIVQRHIRFLGNRNWVIYKATASYARCLSFTFQAHILSRSSSIIWIKSCESIVTVLVHDCPKRFRFLYPVQSQYVIAILLLIVLCLFHVCIVLASYYPTLHPQLWLVVNLPKPYYFGFQTRNIFQLVSKLLCYHQSPTSALYFRI